MSGRLATFAGRRLVRSVNLFSRRGIGSGAQFIRRAPEANKGIVGASENIAGRLATFTAHRVHLGVRSMNLFFRRGIGTGARFDCSEPEVQYNKRIPGAPPMKNTIGFYYLPPSYIRNLPSPCVSEESSSEELQLWKADVCLKPKPDTYVYYRDNVLYEHFVAYSLEEDGTISPKFYICPPSLLVKEYIYTGASCNSLFHFHDKTLGHILWNTATNQLKILPKPLPELSPHDSLFYGMGSGHQSEDYKLMHFARSDFEDQIIYYIDLYSLKTNSWKRIPCPEFVGVDRSFAFIFGVLYCVVYQNQDLFILSFDISTETFSSLPLPIDNSMCGSRYFFLEYKGLLSALECCDHEKDVYELWIMSDGLWTSESVFRTCGVKMPLWFSQDGKLLYFASLTDELVVFDRATGKVKHLGVVCSLGKPMMIPFSESFVDLRRVSDIEEKKYKMITKA